MDRLLRVPVVEQLCAEFPRILVKEALRAALDEARKSARRTDPAIDSDDVKAYIDRAEVILRGQSKPSLRRCINATGVVIHTNLGRSVLANSAIQAVMAIAGGYSTLEMEMETGRRGSRHAHVEDLLRRLTGAEAAAVVNNNAAAVLLALTALARGREVIVSRGQLVEIGGSFRIPDVIESGGARLVEVGTTNRTRIGDYRRAVTPDTALLLRVHPGNFRIVGFTEEASRVELAALGRELGLPVVEDLGSGALEPVPAHGSSVEPTPVESLSAGIDLVTFSGDKLLGGPQAGILVGKKDIVERVRTNPLMRAVRCDKMTLAALVETLRIHAFGRPLVEIPTLRYLSRGVEDLDRLAQAIHDAVQPPLEAEIVSGVSRVGGGAHPDQEAPTVLVALWARESSKDDLAGLLRRNDPPIIGRVQDGRVLLDPRTVEEDDLPIIVAAMKSLHKMLAEKSKET